MDLIHVRKEMNAVQSNPKRANNQSDPSLAPPLLPLAWAFQLRGKSPIANRDKPQFEQGRGRRKHMRAQRKVHHQAIKASPRGGG